MVTKRKPPTKNGSTERDLTKSDALRGVDPRIDLAVDALIGGASITEAAFAAGVTRQTLSKWIHGNIIFCAEMNKRREEARRERLVALSSLVATMENAVRGALNDVETPKSVILQTCLGALPKFYALLAEQRIGAIDAEEYAVEMTRKPVIDFSDMESRVDEVAAARLLARSMQELEQESA